MRRREFITLIGGAAAWPLAARAQQQGRMRRVCILMPYVDGDIHAQKWTKAFSDSLYGLGWKIGRNIELNYRWAGPNRDLLRGDAEELVSLVPDVLLAGATPAAALHVDREDA